MSQPFVTNLATETFFKRRYRHFSSSDVIGQVDPNNILDLDFELDTLVWCPFGSPQLVPILAEVRGYVRFEDLFEDSNVCLVQASDGVEYRVVTKHVRKLHPSVLLVDVSETPVDVIFLVEGSCVWVKDGQEVTPGETIAALPRIRKRKLKDAWQEAQKSNARAELWLVRVEGPLDNKPYHLVWIFEERQRLAQYITHTLFEDDFRRVAKFLYKR